MKAVLTAKEIALALRVSESTVSREAKKGRIPGAHRVGGAWRFTEEVIEKWLTEEQPPTRPEAPPKRRKRIATSVEHTRITENASSSQLIENNTKRLSGNGKAHGTVCPMNNQ